MTTKRFNEVVYDLVHLLKDYTLDELLTAAAYVHKDVPFTTFMEKADEAHDDARQLIPYITNKELGYDES